MNFLMGLVMAYSLQMNYLPYSDFQYYDYYSDSAYYSLCSNMYRVDMNTEISSNIKDHIFTIGGGLKITETFNDNHGFTPLSTVYDLKASYKYKHIEIGFNHSCMHPIYAYIEDPSILGYKFEGSYQEVFIKFSGSNKLFQ